MAGKVLRLPLKLVPRGFNVKVLGGPNRGMVWRTGSSVNGCWIGSYEREKVDILSRFVRPGMVAYDVGANAGYYTMLLSRLVGPTGRVFAFEPFPENLLNLMHHVSVNNLTNCEVVAAAVSEKTGLAGFRAGPSNSMGSLADRGALLQVPTISLDDMIGQGGLPHPDFVKMDVEGAEAKVLAGALGVLRDKPSVWFIALHGEGVARECFKLLADAGFSVHELGGAPVREASAGSMAEVYATRNL